MRIAVESWSPAYGSALRADDDLAATAGSVDVEVEVPRSDWAPVRPAVPAAADVLFVDGVRRIDAQVWLTDDRGGVRLGLCVSYAAGSVRCDGTSHVETCEVRRGLFAKAGTPALVTAAATYEPRAVAADDLDSLVGGVQQRLGELEIQVATAAAAADLVVVDGPLSGRQNVPGAIGYVKTHHVAYLPEDLAAAPARLAPGERTPLFVTQTSWARYAWYLRLPYGRDGHPWSGIVRCEASADLTVAEAARLADRAAATLPRFASHPHKDGRAPQNLYPIGGLERHLRRMLGDHHLLERHLRRAAAAGDVGI